MTSNAASKAMLRDSINRLKRVRTRCGKNDEAQQQANSTGDPFRDACNLFMNCLKETKETINDRNQSAKKYGQDRNVIEQSNDIMKMMRELEGYLKKIRELVDEADRTLAKANKKKKRPDKIQLLERQYNERQNTYNQCQEMLEAVREMNQHRFGDGAKAGLSASQQVRLGAKNAMREQLMNLKKKDAPADGGGEGGGGRRLEDDPETAAQMKVLAEQERKINQGLDQLQKGVGRLHEIALQIGSEIDVQNKMIEATEGKVDKQVNQLGHLNRRLGKLVKDSNPLNVFINIGCGVLLLGLVGYLLYEFGIV